MLNPNEKFWSEEEERIENYLLGRLDDAENRAFEERMRTDEGLRRSVELNAMILAGIRQKGREGLKERLNKNLGMASTPNVVSKNQLFFYATLKIAAVIVAGIGIAFLIYRQVAVNPDVQQVTEETKKEIKNDNANAIKDELLTEAKKGDEKNTAKKSPKVNDKPSVLSAPSEEIPAKRNQRLKSESLKYMRPNELVVNLLEEKEGKTIETKLLFKNPSDLSVLNIQQTQSEQNGQLEWFYVYYENRVLSLYLDNTKYLSYFKNSELAETQSQLRLTVETAQYVVDLSSNEKFKKAILQKVDDKK